MSDTDQQTRFMHLTAEIVASFVANNAVLASDLPILIDDVHRALSTAVEGVTEAEPEPLKPAVPIRKSITPDHLVCLEDGRTFKSLKRHLQTRYGLSPDEYRKRWGLPPDYSMVAPNYAARRSELAKRSGLGQLRKAATAPAVPHQATKRGSRGRKAAVAPEDPGQTAEKPSSRRKTKPAKANAAADEV